MSHEIAPGVHRIELPLGNRRNSAHLVVGDDAVLLFDTGVAGQMSSLLPPALQTAGRTAGDIRHVILSHCDIDHWGGAGDVRDLAPDATFACHGEEKALIEDLEVAIDRRYQEFAASDGIGWDDEYLSGQHGRARPVAIDSALAGGELIDLGGRVVEVLHVPGHSRGHLAVWDAETRTLISGDAVLGDSLRDLDDQLVMPPNYRYPADYRATCARLAELEPHWLIGAHFRPMRGEETLTFLRTSIAYTDVVERALADALSARSWASTRDLVAALQTTLGPWPAPLGDFALAAMVIGHLEEWLADGRIERRAMTDGRNEWRGRS